MPVAVADQELQWEPPSKPIRVLLTGYGPFSTHAENPSTIAGRKLDRMVIRGRPSKLSAKTEPLDDITNISNIERTTGRDIEITFHSLPVTYKAVDNLYTTESPIQLKDFDCLIHVGLSARRKAINLELRARRVGYQSKDVDGELAEVVDVLFGQRGIKGSGEDEFWTDLDLFGLKSFLREESGVEHVEISDDAGLYLCEYMYGSSLQFAKKPPPRIIQSPVKNKNKASKLRINIPPKLKSTQLYSSFAPQDSLMEQDLDLFVASATMDDMFDPFFFKPEDNLKPTVVAVMDSSRESGFNEHGVIEYAVEDEDEDANMDGLGFGNLNLTEKKPPSVLFVHVPSLKKDGGPYDEDELAKILEMICYWVGKQWV